jgi:hypothetical protein
MTAFHCAYGISAIGKDTTMPNRSRFPLLAPLAVCMALGSLLGGCKPDDGSKGSTPTNAPPLSSKSERNAAGVFLERNYKNFNGTIRYVFHASTADVYMTALNRMITVNGVTRETQGLYEDGNFVYGPQEKTTDIPLTPVGSRGENVVYYKSEFDSITVAKPGDWYLILKNIPVTVLEHSVSVDYSSCMADALCAPWEGRLFGGGSVKSIVFNVESDGLMLAVALNPNAKYHLEK